MSSSQSIQFGTGSISRPEPEPEGFLEKKTGFMWFTRYFILYINRSKDEPEVSLKYGKTREICLSANPNKYRLNVKNFSLKSKNTPGNLELPDDELHLERVEQESFRHESRVVPLLKLKFGSIFYRELWENRIARSVDTVASNTRLSGTMDRGSRVLRVRDSVRPPSDSPDQNQLFTNFEEVVCDFSEVSNILAMSIGRSESMRNLCQRLVQLGRKNARHSFKYAAVDDLVSKDEKWNSVNPPFFGLLQIAKNLLRQPSMFALTAGTLGQMTAVTCIVASHCYANKLNLGPLQNEELWVKAQDYLITTLDCLLEEVVQKSKSISRFGSVSVLILELTSARMSLVAIPSGKKMDLAKGVFKFFFGLAKSISGMRLDPNLLSGLGMVASSSLALWKEGWAKDFCTRLSNISNLPDFCEYSQMTHETLQKLRVEVKNRFCNNLFISRSNFLQKLTSDKISEISRWEFHAAFAVMLTKLVLQLTHENLMRINHRSCDPLRSAETLTEVPTFKTKEEEILEAYFHRTDDQFVLQMLLEKLDEAPFIDADKFLKHLKSSDSILWNLVSSERFRISQDEVLSLNEFHQNEQRLLAAVRQIEEHDKKYVLKMKVGVCIPSLSHDAGTPLKEDVKVVAIHQPVHQDFVLKFVSYPLLQQNIEFIAHAKDLISDMIYGFLPSGSDVLDQHGSEKRVKGLLELACYGLDTSFDAVDSHPGFKLATWADKILSMTGTEKLFEEGLGQLKDSLFSFVVQPMTHFDTEQLSDDIDSLGLFAAVDRRMNTLKSADEKHIKAINYVNRFSGLIKLLPLFPAAPSQGISYGENDSIHLFTSIKVTKLKEERSIILQKTNAAISANLRLAVAVPGVPEATVNCPLNEELLDSIRSHGVFQVSVTLEGEVFAKELFKLDSPKVPPSAVLADDVSPLDESLPMLAKANEALTEELVIKLKGAGLTSVLLKGELITSQTLDIEHSMIGNLFAVHVSNVEDTQADSLKFVPLTVDALEKLEQEQEIDISTFRSVELLEIFRQLRTQSHDQNAFSPLEFVNKFLQELLPAILQLLSKTISAQKDRLAEIKLMQNLDDQVATFNSSLSDIMVYSEIASELQIYISDLLNPNGPISSLFCNWNGIGSSVVNEIGSLVTTIKSDVLIELKQLADSELVATGKEVLTQIGDTLSNVGIKSVFNSIGSLLSDFQSAKQAEQEPFRIREVACFCVSLIAAATGSTELQLFLGRQRIKETHPLVKAVLNVTDPSDPAYSPAVFESLLKFWCPVDDISENCLHMFCLSGQSALRMSPQELFFENDHAVELWIRKKFDDFEKIRDEIERMPDDMIVEKQMKIIKLRKNQRELKQIAANVSDMGTKLNIVIEYLSDIQDQLGRMDAKLISIQSGIDEMRTAMFAFTGKPVLSIIDESTKEQIAILNRQLAEDVYVPSHAKKIQYFPPSIKRPGIWSTDDALDRVLFEDVRNPSDPSAPPLAKASEKLTQEIIDKLLRSVKDNLFEVTVKQGSEPRIFQLTSPNDTNHCIVEGAFKRFMMETDCNIFLLTGKAGSGKSTTLSRLKRYILTEYTNERKKMGWSVVLLSASLPSLKNPKSDLFREAAMQTFGADFRYLHVDLLREKCRDPNAKVEIVFFCDAWDELRPEFHEVNLWASNNLERYRPQSKDPTDSRYPKVFFTCREETIEQIRNKNNGNPISCVRHFFPREISDIDKDEDHECYNFFEHWCIQEFPEKGRQAYLNKYVAQNLRMEFFKQIDFVPDASDLVLGSSKSPTKAEMLKSLLLNEAPVSKWSQPIKEFAEAVIDVCSCFLGNLADDALVDSNLHDRRVKSTFKKLLRHVEISSIFVDSDDDLLCFSGCVFASCFALKYDEARQKQCVIDFLSSQRKLLKANQLWMPKSFDDAFKEMKELSDLVKTPFMVQVLSKILPRLQIMKLSYGFADAKKILPRIHITPEIGEIWASHIIPFVNDAHFQQLASLNTPEDLRCRIGDEIFQKFVDSFVNSVRKGTDIGVDSEKSQSEKALFALLLHREDQYQYLVDHFRVLTMDLVGEYLAGNVATPGSNELLAHTGDKLDENLIRKLDQEGIKGVRVSLKSEECQVVLQSEDPELYSALFGRYLAAHIFRISNPSNILAKAGDILTAELIQELRNDGRKSVPVARKSCKDVFDDFGDSGETLGKLHANTRDKIVYVLTSPPLLRGVIYKVFCEYVVQENSRRKRGGFNDSDVLLEAVHYSRNLALHLSTNSLSKLSRTNRSKLFADAHESDKFFRDDNLLSAARYTAPVKVGSEVSFLHKTLQEYFVAECISNNLIESFQLEQITPTNFQAWISDCNDLNEWFHTATLVGMTIMSPRSIERSSDSMSVSIDRLRRLLESIEKCPLNHYDFSSDQEKVSVLDFFIDIMFTSDEFVEILHSLLKLCEKNVHTQNRSNDTPNGSKQALNLKVLARNLQLIVTQKIARLSGRCLMHEVLLQNNFVVFNFCTRVHDSWQKLNELIGENLAPTILDVLDDEGHPPVYYALANPGCLMLDNIAPIKTRALHESIIGKTLSTDVVNPNFEFEYLAEAGEEVTEELVTKLRDAGLSDIPVVDKKGLFFTMMLSDQFDEASGLTLGVDILHPPVAKSGTELDKSLFDDLRKLEVKTVNIIDDKTRYCNLSHKMLEKSRTSGTWGRNTWAKYLENLHLRGFTDAQSMTPLVIEQFISFTEARSMTPLVIEQFFQHILRDFSKDPFVPARVHSTSNSATASKSQHPADTRHDSLKNSLVKETLADHGGETLTEPEVLCDDAASAAAAAAPPLPSNESQVSQEQLQQPIVVDVYIPSEFVVAKLKAAAQGKTANEGGYNLGDMTKFIDANSRLFNKERGPIKDDFPLLSSLTFSDCRRLISYILKLYTPSKEKVEGNVDYTQLHQALTKEFQQLCSCGNFALAVNQLEQLISTEHLPSRAELAYILAEGREGVAKDRKRAFTLVNDVVNDDKLKNCHDCEGMLANCYRLGIGCSKDLKLSSDLAKRSADVGSKFGQFTLGKIYHTGEAESDRIALELFQLSAAQSFSDAQNTLGRLYESGASGILEMDLTKALNFFQLAADQGLPAAFMNLGNLYEKGSSTEDKLEAIRWFKRSLAAGLTEAADKLKQFERVLRVKGPEDLRVYLDRSIRSAHVGTLRQGCSFLFKEVIVGTSGWSKLGPAHYGELQSTRQLCNTSDFRQHNPEFFGYCHITLSAIEGGEVFEEPETDVKTAVMARVQAAERKSEADAAKAVAAADKAAADDIPTVVYISGSSGPMSGSINGGYDPVDGDHSVLYEKRDDPSMCIQHFDGKWQIKLVSDKGSGVCMAFVDADGNIPLGQCNSRTWQVLLDSWTQQPGVKIISGGEAERKAVEYSSNQARVIAEDNSRATFVRMSGMSGLGKSSNGVYRPAPDYHHHRVLYSKDGDDRWWIEYFGGKWLLKQTTERGKDISWAFISSGNSPLEKSLSLTWNVSKLDKAASLSQDFEKQMIVKCEIDTSAANAAKVAAKAEFDATAKVERTASQTAATESILASSAISIRGPSTQLPFKLSRPTEAPPFEFHNRASIEASAPSAAADTQLAHSSVDALQDAEIVRPQARVELCETERMQAEASAAAAAAVRLEHSSVGPEQQARHAAEGELSLLRERLSAAEAKYAEFRCAAAEIARLEKDVAGLKQEVAAERVFQAACRRVATASSTCEYFALQIGLSYAETSRYRLEGCVKDIESMSDFFSRRQVQFSTHVVLSDQSTAIDATHKFGGCRDDILAGMKLITDAMHRSVAANKFLFFHVCGHGTQIRDAEDEDEADGFDEALCPCDFETAGAIVDDDLSQWLESLPSHQLFAVCDCCHNSGTCLDLGEFSGFFCCGCRDDQVSADAKSLGSSSGALTACLIHALSSGDCSLSIIAARVCGNLLQCAFDQKPVMICTTSSVLDGWGADFPKAAESFVNQSGVSIFFLL